MKPLPLRDLKKPEEKGKYGIVRATRLSLPGRGAIACWPFEDQAGSVLKDIIGGYDGTLKNMEDADWKASGINKLGNCLEFDGSNEYVEITSDIYPVLQSLEVGAISLWFNSHDTGNNCSILNVSDSADAASYFWLVKLSPDKIGIWVKENSVWQLRWESTATFANDQVWHHLVYSTGTSFNAIYIDGVLAAGTYMEGNAATRVFFADVFNIDFAAIGTFRSGGALSNYWKGKIAQVVIYDRALSAAEIANLYRYYGRTMRRRIIKVRLDTKKINKEIIKRALAEKLIV